MHDIRIIGFTSKGVLLAHRIAAELSAKGAVATVHTVHSRSNPANEVSLHAWVAQAWNEADALVFVGACAIAVRSIAPHLVSKLTDPAVVVVDEAARYVVSLVSGHVGGANKLANVISSAIGAIPVVTTATDSRKLLSVDAWAAKHNMVVVNPGLIKDVSMALLEGKTVGFTSDIALAVGALPAGFVDSAGDGLRVMISHHMPGGPMDSSTLLLVPRVLSVGIGCRKGVNAQEIKQAIDLVFSSHSLDTRAIFVVSSIDIKQHEEGLLEYCKGQQVALEFHNVAKLQAVSGDFVESAVVKRTVGVGSVSDRSAVASAHGGVLVIPRRICTNVTVAVARIPLGLDFSLEESL